MEKALAALEGKLAEGVDPVAVIEELQAAGWQAPEGDDYEEDGPPKSADTDTPPPEEAVEEGEGEGIENEMPKGLMIALRAKPGEMNERRGAAARFAMKKHGPPDLEDLDEE